jgi:hypothetical protein
MIPPDLNLTIRAMSSSSPTGWRPTEAEMPVLLGGIAATVSALIPGFAPFATPAAVLASYVLKRRDLFFREVGGSVAPQQAWDVWGRPVYASRITRGGAEYDLLSLLDWRVFTEQRVTVVPRLTPAARAAGLRDGDPVSVALMTPSWKRSESNLIIPARVGSSVTIAVPRSDYRVVALGSRADELFWRHDPIAAVGGGAVLRRRTETELSIPLYDREARARVQRQIGGDRVKAQSPLRGGKCIYCGRYFRRDLLGHSLRCPNRPAALKQLTRTPIPAATTRLSSFGLGRCMYCGKDFGLGIAQHAPTCPRRPRVCAICHATFNSYRALNQHIKVSHPGAYDLMAMKRRSGSRRRVSRR